MTKPEDLPYFIEGRELIAETSDLRVQILTLEAGEEVPWHFHSEVTDTFICLEGPMTVETKSAPGTKDLQSGDTFSVAPNEAHRVTGKDGGRCRFVNVQGIGAHDFIPTEGS